MDSAEHPGQQIEFLQSSEKGRLRFLGLSSDGVRQALPRRAGIKDFVANGSPQNSIAKAGCLERRQKSARLVGRAPDAGYP